MLRTGSLAEQVVFTEGHGDKQGVTTRPLRKVVVIFKCSDCARSEKSIYDRYYAADAHQQRNILLFHAVQKQSSVFDEQIRVLVDSTVV